MPTDSTTPPPDPPRDLMDSGDTDNDKELDELMEMVLDYAVGRRCNLLGTLRSRLSRLLRVERALKFYADPATYEDGWDEDGDGNRYKTSWIAEDCGEQARTALNPKEPDDGKA